MFYYLFCCCIWTRLWERYSEKRKEKKKNELKEKEANKRDIRNSSNPDELDDDGQTDESEFDENQEFKRTTFPFPSMPFSTSNRMQSAAVYVIYTYDVLNIFVYIYTASISTIELYEIFLMKKLSVP